MSPKDKQTERNPRSKRGQTLAEFALTLPILLMLMFGVIEFARIFQAWVTLQNSAREAARYAITGRWDENIVAQAIAYTRNPEHNDEQHRAAVLDELVPCTAALDQSFTNHWGKDCDPGKDEDQGLRADMARLPSIVNRARIGAAGLSTAKGDNIVGLTKQDGASPLENQETVNSDQRGWFHTYICSSRKVVQVEASTNDRYKISEDRNDRLCQVLEAGPALNSNQYDAGGPGDTVEIIVFFNHPLITPLGLVDYVQLQARRVMINESFRASRVVNLPEQLGGNTYTPSATSPPTETLPPSASPLPTETSTNTPTNTLVPSSTATPTPDCALVVFDSDPVLVGQYLQIRIRNDNEFAPVFITKADVVWQKHGLYPNMYAEEMGIVGRSPFWVGPDYVPNTVVDSLTAGWRDDPPDYVMRMVDPDSAVTTWQIKFTNGPTDLNERYSIAHFRGTTIYMGTEWGGVNTACQLRIPGTLVVLTETPTTPVPRCEDYVIAFQGFETNGVVRYSIQNTGTAVANLTGFNIIWNAFSRTFGTKITLDTVKVGGPTAFDPAAVTIWDGSDNSSPATAASGGTGWLVNAAIPPGTTANVWLDFDGTNGRLDAIGYDAAGSDFNGTTFTLNYVCPRQSTDVPPPGNTNTPRPTNTPTKTKTPKPTGTKTPTKKPGTPTKTPTKKPNTPTKTNTPKNTPLPTRPGGGVE